ncbi:MAG TPA: hypothetical protein VFG18_01105 [Xanthomonadaceae bacterium]|nr:hypothetical protein [Xanthomonadaceae bacterium]
MRRSCPSGSPRAQIRTALEHDPDARFLLDQLRRTYAQRLALTQRAAFA